MKQNSKIEQIEKELLEKILKGGYLPHDRFFSVNELKELYSVSQATVTRVLEKLETSGYLYREAGHGTFISPQSKVRQILIVASSNRVISQEHNLFSHGIESICANDSNFILVEISEKDFLEKYENIKIIYKNIYAVIFFRVPEALEISKLFLEREEIIYLYYGALSTCAGNGNINHYCYDDRELIWTGLDMLYKKGHRKIGCLYMDKGVYAKWYNEYIAWMIEKGLYIDKNYVFRFTAEPEKAYNFLFERFSTSTFEVSAFFCITNYFLGTSLVQALLRVGVSIPERVAIAGVSNQIFNKHIYPHLATVSMDVIDDAVEIMKMIFEAERKQLSYEDIKFCGKSRISTIQGETI